MNQTKLARRVLVLITAAAAIACATVGRPASAQPPAPQVSMTPDEARAQYKQLTKQYFVAELMGESGNALKAATDMVALTDRYIGENSVEYGMSLDRLGESNKRAGDYTTSADNYRKGIAILDAAAGPQDVRTLAGLNALAYDLDMLGQYLAAEPIYRQVLSMRIKVLGERDPATLESMNGLAYTLDTLDRYTESEPLLRKALDLRIEILDKNDPDIATSYNNLAYNLNMQGHYEEADSCYEKAVNIYEAALGTINSTTLRTISAKARNLEAEGKYTEAEEALRDLIKLGGGPFRIDLLQQAEFMSALAYTLDDEGKHAEAEQLYRQELGIEIGKLGPENPRVRITSGNLAFNLLSQPDRAYLALDPARTAAAAVERSHAMIGRSPRADAQYLRSALSQKSNWLFLADADWGAAQRMPQELAANRAEAFRTLQWAMQGSTSQAIALTAARRRVGERNTKLSDLAQEREALSSAWEKLDRDATRTLGDVKGADSAKLNDLARQQAQIESQLNNINQRLRKQAPAYYALTRPQPLDMAHAKALLARDEALLMIVPTEFGTHVLAITRGGIQWTRSPLTKYDINAAVDMLRNGLDPEEISRFGTLFSRQLSYRLYQSLINPVMSALTGKRHVFIAADGALASLPFSVLVTAAPQGRDDDPQAMRDTHWFGDAQALVQIPSLQSLQFLRTYRPPPSTPRNSVTFEGYGDPVLAGAAELRGADKAGHIMPRTIAMRPTRDGAAIADVAMLRNLPSLPGTAQELDRIREALNAGPSTVHIQANATETAVKSADLLHVRILAFATHGLMAGDLVDLSEPGLVLTPPAEPNAMDDGILTASEITSLSLDADLVILSACNSASANKAGEAPLSGLARAFFYAGARSLLVSHWPVYDDVAPRITITLLKARRDNPKLSGAEALQHAIIDIRNDPDDSSLAFPSVWAPFVLVGDGAR